MFSRLLPGSTRNENVVSFAAVVLPLRYRKQRVGVGGEIEPHNLAVLVPPFQ